jgi:Helix-turn-helix domain of resolvase
MFRPSLTAEQWAQARRLREEGATFAAIAGQFGVARSTVAYRANKEGWLTPAGSLARVARTATPASGAESTIDMRRVLARRFYRVMGLNLELMELRMTKKLKDARKRGGAGVPSADVEESVRPMNTALKGIDQVKELDPDFNRPVDGGPISIDPDAAASEADAFRNEIAERLEKLLPPS